MTRPIAACALVAVALGGGCDRGAPPFEARASLLATERQFASASETHGMKVAFLRFLADDAILFRPHPVNGKRFTALQEESDIELSWEPVRARVASSGELGWTTGPFRVESGADAGPASGAAGYFLSVWERQPNRRWKVVIDLGTEHPPDRTCPEPPGDQTPTAGARIDPGDPAAEATGLLDLERRLAAQALEIGAVAAMAPHLAADARVYRDGFCPAVGADAARARLEGTRQWTWEPIAGTVARSGDLAYTYGSYRGADEEPSAVAGYYVRIWSRDEPGEWRLAADVTNPLPAGSGQASAGS